MDRWMVISIWLASCVVSYWLFSLVGTAHAYVLSGH